VWNDSEAGVLRLKGVEKLNWEREKGVWSTRSLGIGSRVICVLGIGFWNNLALGIKPLG
jgi:hypothetical protein